MESKIDKHLQNIKNIQSKLDAQYQQGLQNVDAMVQNCKGFYNQDGTITINRADCILWFANDRHKLDYGTPDPL